MHSPFSGGSRGGSGEGVGLSDPPLRQNYFIFMENFQKNQEKRWGASETKLFHFHGEFSEKSGKINEKSGKVNKANTLRKFEPPIKKSWIRPSPKKGFIMMQLVFISHRSS